MFHFLHTFNPEPILFSVGPINIYWYGFFILLGAISAFLVMLKLASYYNIKKDTIIDLAFWLIIGGIIGARIYHVFLELPYYLNHPINIFKIWQGGLAIHGGIIAGGIIIYFFSKKHKINFWLTTSIIVPGLALAQAIGRWGNYFNQELFGLSTDRPWGIPIDVLNRPAEFLSSEFFHPTFIYESIGNFIIFLFLIFFISYTIKKNISNTKIHQSIVLTYLIFYSILRFSLEYIRIDTTPEFLGFRFPQIASLIIIAISIIVIIINRNSEEKFKKMGELEK